ncbi:alternative ribosome rescue aminoacyl-tRNA hydrolase ArfB [Saccharopolyspora gloriosae]|uniref:alternative ribosome rescue aminoacyl-tRNA hydrolase ArfB n=1 Tax=Saccharopolyspora gloriosae TaxID=455344 RepID=UPI001FB6983A|nr:alternative ribosome rescue aminoacyl-tRNA hydrolase ArfB [Saccharopolyspora gloriosae]
MPEDLRITSKLTVSAAELTERFSRSSGPGGQHVNTSDSRVELAFDLANSKLPEPMRNRALSRLESRLVSGVLTVVASEHRSQLFNRAAARERLAELLAEAIAPEPPPRRRTKPTAGSRRRRLDGKKRRGQVKQWRRRGDPEDS